MADYSTIEQQHNIIMKMSKVGNQTNSQDPQAVNSRVFVGNLNTFQCSKTDVERMFQRYGRLAGISMHKGYAFVQFTNPFDARSACLGEDGRTILSQILDVNMVAEPKPHQTGRKRQNVSKTGNDWDYYYDSYYASTAAGFPVGPSPRLVPPLKRPRLMAPPGRPAKIAATGQSQQKTNNNNNGNNITTNVVTSANNIALQQGVINNTTTTAITTTSCNSVTNTPNGGGGAGSTTTSPGSNSNATATGNINNNNNATTNVCNINNGALHAIDQLKTYSNPDILICGNCREMFTDLKELIEHKKVYCKLRFTCKCHTFNSNNPPGDEITGFSTLSDTTTASTTVSLLCVQCKDSFPNAWDLMVHAQAAHMVNIYELGIANKQQSSINGTIDDSSSEPPTSPTDNNQIQSKEDNKTISSTLSNGTTNGSSSDYEGNCLLITNSSTDSTITDNHRNSNHDDLEENGNVVKIDIDEIMDMDTTSTPTATKQSCIMHALTIFSGSGRVGSACPMCEFPM
ncbi:CAR1 transcription factor-like isoform X2 [Chrysoperla carnea]|uniref:CAR1 transcription factor-like isoform X2 n=1 Tax=Chrysoperla carnea TaxID=189513 RepID=UPI001D091A49|nr:CAR1 transcription factor-like isoform X2 [Chrysoperla carnea]